MSTLYLGHTFTTVEDCEDIWNEYVDGDTTASADATVYVVGSKSAKFITDASMPNQIIASEVISSTDLSACTHVAAWVRSSNNLAAGAVQLLLDEDALCASPSESLDFPAITANTWTRCVWALAGTAASRNAIISVGLKQIADMAGYNLYIDDIQAFIGNDYDILWHKGLTDIEDLELNAAEVTKLIDGSYHAWDVPSHNRIVTVAFGPVTDTTDRGFILTTWKKATMRVIADGAEVTAVRGDPSLSAEWLNGIDFAKAFTLTFLEKTAQTVNPPSWS